MASNGDSESKPFKSRFRSIVQFDHVGNNREINTEHLLAACTAITSILGDLGSAFSFPKKDMLGNIKKIRERYESNPEKYSTLNKVLEEDSSTNKKKPTNTVIGIIWLVRAMDFLRALLTNIVQEFKDKVREENLRPTMIAAYEATLKSYHGSIVQFAVSNTFRLAPYRSSLLNTLATDPSVTHDVVISDLDDYLVNFSATIDLIRSLQDEYNLNLSLTA